MITMLLSLINIGSTVAFNAMISLSTTALMATYLISIGCLTLKRLRGLSLPHARWSLGRCGLTVNIIALVYACWAFFWSFWPNSYNPNAVNFNWASSLFVGMLMIAAAVFGLYARNHYQGPVVSVEGRRDE